MIKHDIFQDGSNPYYDYDRDDVPMQFPWKQGQYWPRSQQDIEDLVDQFEAFEPDGWSGKS
jgi:hypothetical protein